MALYGLKEKWSYQAANFHRKLFASDTEPENPDIGEVWLNTSTTTHSLFKWDGTSWVGINGLNPLDISNSNLNTVTGSGALKGTYLQNNPSGNNSGFHIIQLEFDSSYKIQIALHQPTNNASLFQRNLNNGVWSTWHRILTDTSIESGRVEVPNYPASVFVPYSQAFTYTPTPVGNPEAARLVSVFNKTSTGFEATATDSPVWFSWFAL